MYIYMHIYCTSIEIITCMHVCACYMVYMHINNVPLCMYTYVLSTQLPYIYLCE